MAYPLIGSTTMMLRNVLIGSFAGLAMLAEPAAAQGRGNARQVPPGHLPPAGMCRAWIDGVPPGRQPRVTDCRTARAQAARYDGRVIYGDDYAHKGKAKGKYKNKDRRDDDRDGRRADDRDGRRADDRDGRRAGDRRDDDRRDAGTPAPRSGGVWDQIEAKRRAEAERQGRSPR